MLDSPLVDAEREMLVEELRARAHDGRIKTGELGSAIVTGVERVMAARAAELAAQINALPRTRTKAWLGGWDSVALDDVRALLGRSS